MTVVDIRNRTNQIRILTTDQLPVNHFYTTIATTHHEYSKELLIETLLDVLPCVHFFDFVTRLVFYRPGV